MGLMGAVGTVEAGTAAAGVTAAGVMAAGIILSHAALGVFFWLEVLDFDRFFCFIPFLHD